MPTRVPDLETAQRALLDAFVPGATCRRLAWSQGETQVIEAGSGPPVLFVHGGFSQATEWIPLWPQLVERHRLIAVDRPGHGLADPYDFRGVDTRDLAAEFLGDVLDHLELDRVPLVGNSMGGRWGVELALRQPKRISRLILVGAPAGSKARIPTLLLTLRWPVTRPLMRRMFRRSEPKGVRDFLGKVLVAKPEQVTEPFLVAMAAGQRRNYDSMLSFAKQIITYHSIDPDLVLTDLWSQIEVPVHFIWGEEDAFDAPATGEAAVAKIRTESELTVVPGAGHLPWLDDTQAVARAVERALETSPLSKHPSDSPEETEPPSR